MGLSGRLSDTGRLSGNLIGSGTYDYNDLNNKPQINSVTLQGNKSSSDLGLQDEINFPGDATKYLNGAGNFSTPSGGSGDYDDLTDKPQINGVTLEGNCSSDDLQLQDKIQFPMTPNVYLDGEGNFTAITGVDYDNLTNKPTINGYVLSGAVSLSDIGAEPTISYSGNIIQYMDGSGNFTIPNYNNIQNRPQINGHVLTGDQSSDDLDLQDKINFPEDSTQFLDGTGAFRTPDYFSGDYDDLTDKPQINGVTLEGDKSSSDLHLVSEIHDVGPAAEVDFEADDTLPLLSCITDIVATQSGSGTPSPSNPRPITGYTDANITVTDGDTTNVTTVPLGRTVYGGTLDVTNGLLKVTHACIDLGVFNWVSENTALSGLARINVAEVSPLGAEYNQIPICSQYEGKSPKSYSQFVDGEIAFSNSEIQPMIRMRDENTSGMTDAQIKTYLSGVTFCYELATPQTYNLTPEEVRTILGDNEISSDTGDIQVTYVTNVTDPLLKWLIENR